jgi:hypothetical protein
MSDLNLPPIDDTLNEIDTTSGEPTVIDPQDPALSQDPNPAASPTPQDDLWEVKVNGKSFRVPREELIAGYQRQQDYTRKTMQIAERQREFEKIQSEHQQFLSEREELRKFLSDPLAVNEYLKQLNGQGAPGSDQPVTAAQLQQFYARQAQMQQQAMEQRMAAMTQELEVRQTAAQYNQEINTTIAGALEQFPELKSVRRIDKILRDEVAEREPSTIEEAKSLFLQVAKEQADALRSYVAEEKKRAAAQKDRLNAGIEPPGGRGIQPKPESFKLGSDALRDAFLRDIQSINSNS